MPFVHYLHGIFRVTTHFFPKHVRMKKKIKREQNIIARQDTIHSTYYKKNKKYRSDEMNFKLSVERAVVVHLTENLLHRQ